MASIRPSHLPSSRTGRDHRILRICRFGGLGAVVALSVGLASCYFPMPASDEDADTAADQAAAGESILTLRGTLRAGDEQLESGEHYDIASFDAVAGDRIRIAMKSTEVDPYLILISPAGEWQQNDDWQGSTELSRIDATLEQSGTWTVWATTAYPGESGAYELAVEALAGAKDPAPTAAPLAGGGSGQMIGATARVRDPESIRSGRLDGEDDTLDSGEYYEIVSFEGGVGDYVEMDLRSAEFDPYLIVTTPAGETFENDDHEGSSQHARLGLELAAAGTYEIAVTTAAPGESGAWDLAIRRQPGGEIGDLSKVETGTLAEGDETLESGEYADLYLIAGRPGQLLEIALTSSAFDPYLIVTTPSGEHIENDDAEGGTGRDSAIRTLLPEFGTYGVIVTSYQKESGAYRLSIERGEAQVATAAVQGPRSQQTESSRLGLGAEVRGTLAEGDPRWAQDPEGEFFDRYTFDGQLGQSVAFEMDSEDFDSYLVVTLPTGETLHSDDDWEFDGISRVAMELPVAGRYRLDATSFEPGESGDYVLRVRSLAQTQQAAGFGAAARAERIFALSVGISDYQGVENDLEYTAEDAHSLHSALISAGMRPQNGVVLTDSDATRDAFVQSLRDLAGRMTFSDTLVLFYSGHGDRIPRADGFQRVDPDSIDETLVLYDQQITDDELNDLLAEIPGRVLIFLDSCFSGGFAKDVISAPGRMGLFSSEEDVPSAVATKFRAGGYLAVFLADALAGQADGDGDGSLTALELSQYVHERYRFDVKGGGVGDFVRIGGPSDGYQHLVVDRGSIGPYETLFLFGR